MTTLQMCDYPSLANSLLWEAGLWEAGLWEAGLWEAGLWEAGLWEAGWVNFVDFVLNAV